LLEGERWNGGIESGCGGEEEIEEFCTWNGDFLLLPARTWVDFCRMYPGIYSGTYNSRTGRRDWKIELKMVSISQRCNSEEMNAPRMMKLARTAMKRAMLRKMGPARASGKP
jgi:hypothetical protein